MEIAYVVDVSVEHSEVESLCQASVTSLRLDYASYFILAFESYVRCYQGLKITSEKHVLAGVCHDVALTCESRPFQKVEQHFFEWSRHTPLVDQIDGVKVRCGW